MLRQLHIRNLAIIDTLELNLDSGMSVLSGETGAGKSILIDALGLVLGERASPEAIRGDCEKAEISAEFDIANNTAAHDWLSSAAMLDEDEPAICRLRRVVSRDGRGKQLINGSPCSVRELRDLGDNLVEIHGQHANQSLMRRDAQRDILDGYGRHASLLQTVRSHAGDWQRLRDDIDNLRDQASDGGARLEFLGFQIQELEALNPLPDEPAQLEQELRSLSHGEEILERGHAALDRLYDADEGSAHSLLGEARRALQEVARHEPAFAEIAATVESAEIAVKEAAGDLRDRLESTELDPQRLEWVNNRLSELHAVARKHRVEDQDLPGLLARLQAEHEALQEADQRLGVLEREQATALTAYRAAATELSKARSGAAKSIAAAIQKHLRQLGMPEAKMAIDVTHDPEQEPARSGSDAVEFRISANPGQPLQPLSKVASGGELSRVSLAIQLECARLIGTPTMIFDEVDAGIGGGVAEMVGRSLAQLAEHQQVLCVTHLPQVAAQSGQQFQVRKEVLKGETFTRITPLDETQRVEELARMLGGVEITEQTRAHAQEMMRKAG